MFDDARLRDIENSWKSDEYLAKIQSNWNMYEKLCNQLGDRTPAVKELLETFGERAVMAPASGRIEYHNAVPGGFIDHSLRVMSKTISIAGALGVKASKESLIISSLFHDFGKVGTVAEPYYIFNDSDWHRKRGMMYEKNPNIRWPNAELGLFNLSQFGVKLSEDEWLAIRLNDGQYSESNKEFSMKEPKLALLIHFADRWATQCEKGRVSILDDDLPKF